MSATFPQPYPSHWKTGVFSSDDADRCRRVADEYPLATLCAAKDSVPAIGHGPVFVDGERCFVHISKLNEFAPFIREGSACTCLFHGPNSFVSSRWYEEVTAPTWNFVIVRAEVASMRWLQDEAEIGKILMRLVHRNEQRVGEGFMPKLPEGYLDYLIPEIVMAELIDIRWSGLFKLNQNKLETEQQRIVKELGLMGGIPEAVSREMVLDRQFRGLEQD